MCHSEEFFKGFQILLWWCGSPHRVLTSCLLALASAAPERHPRLGGNQTLRRRQTSPQQKKHTQKKTRSHTKSEEVTVTHALEAGLTDVRPVRDDQPFLPVFQTCAPPPQIQVDTQQTEGGGGNSRRATSTHFCLCARSLRPLRTGPGGGSPRRYLGPERTKAQRPGGVKA